MSAAAPLETPDLELLVVTKDGERVVPLTGGATISVYAGTLPGDDHEPGWLAVVGWRCGSDGLRDEVAGRNTRFYLRPVRATDRKRRRMAEEEAGDV